MAEISPRQVQLKMLQGRASRAEAKTQRVGTELIKVNNELCERRAEAAALQLQLSTEGAEKRQLQVSCSLRTRKV